MPQRIVVLGSVNIDLVVALPRLPRPAETIIGQSLQTFPGGKGANQAVASARLGGQVAMVGRVGRDGFGERLLEGLRADQVDISGLERDPEQPTGAALILVENGGQNMIAVAPGANARVGEAELQRVRERLEPGGVLMLQLEIPLTAVAQAVQMAREREARVILNAAPATAVPDSLLRGVDVLVVNEIEAGTLFGRSVETLADAMAAASAGLATGPRAVIVTLGEAGAVVAEASLPEPLHVPAFRVSAEDATAAGDAFVGALAVTLANGGGLTEAARRGAAAGALAAMRRGAQSSLPRADELERFLKSRP